MPSKLGRTTRKFQSASNDRKSEELLRRVRLVRSVAELDALGEAWRQLYSPERHTVFQTFAWNWLAAKHFAFRQSLCVAYAEDDNGIAIIPAAIAHDTREIVLLGDALFDYRDILSAGDFSALLAAAWQALAALNLPLSITAIREESREHWTNFPLEFFCRAPQVLRAEACSATLEAAHRKLGRFARRLQRNAIQFRRQDGSASGLIRWIYREKAVQFFGRHENVFADQSRVEFIVAAASMAPSQCEIFTFEHGTEVVAALLTFRDGKNRRFYTVYFDPRWARESPGQVLLFNVTRNSLSDGLDCDYMTGEQPHKTRLATSSTGLYRVQLASEDFLAAASGTVGELAA